MADLPEVVFQAMALPISERAALAHELLLSLEESRPAETAPKSLQQIVAARQQRIRSGNYTAYDAEETLEHIRQSLSRRSGA
jgi:hypothetical protein